jgi:hypothetical protein
MGKLTPTCGLWGMCWVVRDMLRGRPSSMRGLWALCIGGGSVPRVGRGDMLKGDSLPRRARLTSTGICWVMGDMLGCGGYASDPGGGDGGQNSNLVLTAETRTRDATEPSGEPETLVGRLKKMGDRVQFGKPEGLEERKAKKKTK